MAFLFFLMFLFFFSFSAFCIQLLSRVTFNFSITKSCNLWEVLWFHCRGGRLGVFPPPAYKNPGKRILFRWKRSGHRWSNNTNYQLPLLYSLLDNYNLAIRAKFSKLRCEHTFKPKLAKLPNWTNPRLHTVHRVHNLLLHPEATYLLYSKARQQSGCMGSTQTCHNLPPQLLLLMSCQKDTPQTSTSAARFFWRTRYGISQVYRTTRMTHSVKNSRPQ